ncbi:MAG: hypothetical protein ABR612_04455 [Chromatocurvus sp.]
MTEVFVIRDQNGCYWGKSKEWQDGRDPRQLARYRHRDEAVNTLVEISARDIDLRGEIISAALSERGEPQVAPGRLKLADETP